MRDLEPQRVAHCLDDAGQADLARPCPVLGERSEAFVVVNAPGVSAAVREFCAARLPGCKTPDFVNIPHAPLPRNANGKLQKSGLHARLGEALRTPATGFWRCGSWRSSAIALRAASCPTRSAPSTARVRWDRRAKSAPLQIFPGHPVKGWHGGSGGPSLRTREPLECSTVA